MLQKCEKSAVKRSIERLMLINFLDLSTILCPRFSDETYFYLYFNPDSIELTFLIYFRISKDSFALLSHIFGDWVATRPTIHIFQQAIFRTLLPK